MFEPGDKIGDVEVLARLRAGGMAALYLGRREGAGGFSKQLAIKVIHSHLATDKSFVEMFVDEARLSARIDHPNVVRVEALRELQGSYCLLMEFVHGCSLSQLMGTLKQREMRFSPELAVALAIRVADGLHAAHELLNPDGTPAGVVHRDVSPANVLVGYRGDVKLIDFGIAKASQRLHQTEAAGLKGKIAYMSPEQAFGRDVDRRCDVYALGIVLWEMLTMRRLFKADNDLRLLDMVRDPKVVPPSAVVPGIPPALDRVVLEALGSDMSSRPSSARELRYKLLDALPGAAAVDPLQISAVVCDVMSDKIAEDRELFSLSSFNALPSLSAKDSVTVSRLLRPAHGSVEVELGTVGHDASDLAKGFPAAASRMEPPTLLPGTDGPSRRSRRRLLPAVIGGAAVLGVAFGVVSAVAIFADQGAASAADVTPSADAVAASPPEQDEPASAPVATGLEAPQPEAPTEETEPSPQDAVAAAEPTDAPPDPGEEGADESGESDAEDGQEDPEEIAATAETRRGRAARRRRGRRARRRRRAARPPTPQPLAPSAGSGTSGSSGSSTGSSGGRGSGRRTGRPGITDWEI